MTSALLAVFNAARQVFSSSTARCEAFLSQRCNHLKCFFVRGIASVFERCGSRRKEDEGHCFAQGANGRRKKVKT